jgi:hypothetical protein
MTYLISLKQIHRIDRPDILMTSSRNKANGKHDILMGASKYLVSRRKALGEGCYFKGGSLAFTGL